MHRRHRCVLLNSVRALTAPPLLLLAKSVHGETAAKAPEQQQQQHVPRKPRLGRFAELTNDSSNNDDNDAADDDEIGDRWARRDIPRPNGVRLMAAVARSLRA
jgi:hypothetical protein